MRIDVIFQEEFRKKNRQNTKTYDTKLQQISILNAQLKNIIFFEVLH